MSFRKTLGTVVSLIVLAALLAACGGAAEPTTAPAAPAEPAATPEPTATPDPLADWITFTAPDGSFTVWLPEEPATQSQTVPTEAGDIEIAMYMVESDDWMLMLSQNGFPASVADLVAAGDEAFIQSLLDNGRDGAIGNMSGTLQDEKQVTVDGFPGREFTFIIDSSVSPTGSAFTGIARVILVKDMLYQMIRLSTADEADPDLAQAFFDSFHLTAGQ
jgi:hypothetical protein